MAAPVRIALVGYGYWGPNVLRNLFELQEAEVVAVCDARPEALDKARRRYPGLATTTDYVDLLANDAIDAIAITTPVSSHFELAWSALEAGKHVFVEKPLASSSAEAVSLAEFASEQQLVLMPGHTFLYSPPVNMIRELTQTAARIKTQ